MADSLIDRYISPESRQNMYVSCSQGFELLKSNDYKIHLGLSVAVGALLWLKDTYALNLVLGITGAVVYKKCSEQVMTCALVLKNCAKESNAVRLICLISTFAVTRLCPWRAASFVFGYYVAATFFDSAPVVAAVPAVLSVSPPPCAADFKQPSAAVDPVINHVPAAAPQN